MRQKINAFVAGGLLMGAFFDFIFHRYGWGTLNIFAMAINVWGAFDFYGATRPPDHPPYSTDMNAAMLIVKKMHPNRFVLLGPNENVSMWRAIFQNEETKESWAGDAPTPAHAICLASLAVVGHKFGEEK